MKNKFLIFLLTGVCLCSNAYCKQTTLTERIKKEMKVKTVTENCLKQMVNSKKITIKDIYDSKENDLCVLANKFSMEYDSDKDGLCDYYEIFKYNTNPNNPDSDGDGIPDGDENERKEFANTLTFTVRVFNVYDTDYMTNAFQDYKIINKEDNYSDIEITHYIDNTCYKKIYENKNWKNDYKNMKEYLDPTFLCNWDEKMRSDLKKELLKSNINVDKLSDVQVVQKVSRWIEQNNKRGQTKGLDIFIQNDGKELFLDSKRQDLFEKNLNVPFDEYKKEYVFGKDMFYNRTIGECTSSSTYYATIFRALGIPTRIISMSPSICGIDQKEVDMVENISNDKIKNQIKKYINKGWGNHYHTQVFVGNQWVDLEYAHLGHNFSADNYLTFITLNCVNDVSQFQNIANDMWFDHVYNFKKDSNFVSWVPYQLINIEYSAKAH